MFTRRSSRKALVDVFGVKEQEERSCSFTTNTSARSDSPDTMDTVTSFSTSSSSVSSVDAEPQEGLSPVKRMRTSASFVTGNKSPAQQVANRLLRRALVQVTPPKKIKKPIRSAAVAVEWSSEEVKALVQFIAMHRDKQANEQAEWPGMKAEHPYWKDAAEYIHVASNCSLRQAGSLRSKSLKLSSAYGTVERAEDQLGITIDCYMDDVTPEPVQLSLPQSLSIENVNHLTASQKDAFIKKLLPSISEDSLLKMFSENVKNFAGKSRIRLIKDCFMSEDIVDPVGLLDELLFAKCSSEDIGLPAADFISLSISAMKKLKAANKKNLVYKWPRCIALTRPNSEECLLPMNRMPFGLIEYQIDFFNATHINQVKEPEDYELRLFITLFSPNKTSGRTW